MHESATDTLPERGSRVAVAMSGGVDSAVTAALLVDAGCEVIGLTLQLYDHGAAVGRPGSCCAGQDIHDARRVADRLEIPHYVLDYQARFRERVIDDFADSYLAGETPIPCVRCNQRIKFEDLLGMARGLGATALATGHYVRRIDGIEGPKLYQASDAGRDQSYFLFATTREQLEFLRFPLGAFDKHQTRALACHFGLGVAAKRDSQDICFVPSGRYADLLHTLRPGAEMPGEIVDGEGRVLGRHAGISRFTIGQRRGLGIAAAQPLHVVRLEPEHARVVVGPVAALLATHFRLREVNWLGHEPKPKAELQLLVKLRSTMPAVAARVELDNAGGGEVRLETPHPAIAPGQACVFYQGDRLMGGGFIARPASAA